MHAPEGLPLEHHLEGGQLVQSRANLREASNPSKVSYYSVMMSSTHSEVLCISLLA